MKLVRTLAIAAALLLWATLALADDAQRRLEDALSFGGDMEKLKAVLKERPDLLNKPLPGMFKNYPIHEAVGDKTDTLKYLISLKADLNVKSGDGSTALRQAAGYGKFEALKLLLEAGADPNIPEDDGDYPLHEAAGYGRAEFARELIKHGANVNVADEDGATPLISAATNGHAEVAAVLLMAGADKNAATKWGVTALSQTESPPMKDRKTGYDLIHEMLTGKVKPEDVASGKVKATDASQAQKGEPAPATEQPKAEDNKNMAPAPAPAATPKAAEVKDDPVPIVDGKEAKSAKKPKPAKKAKADNYKPRPTVPGFTIDRASVPDLHIAVLSGDGKPDSARDLMRKIIRKGILVERIGVAEVRLDITTVFYGERGEDVARRLAGEIAGAEVKPMSWQSKFDIVVITGGK